MNLLLTCVVVLTINSIMLFAYQQKSFLINMYNELYTTLITDCLGLKGYSDIDNRGINISRFKKGLFGISRKEKKLTEARRLHELNLEKAKLNKRLKTLEFITDFELYLNQNNIDREKFDQFKEFSELKLITQKSILESTSKVSHLNAA